ncbi:MAG: hypothetical protein ACI8PZ_000196 [Myxococcota bacterium]|jgi:hypothetical protein
MVRAAVAVVAMLTSAESLAATRAQLSVNADTIAVGQAVAAQVVLVGSAARRPPVLPPAAGVEVSYQGKSERMTLRGRRAETIYVYQYAVRAMSEGTLTLGPVTVETVDGETVRTESVRFTVTPRSAPDAEAAPITVRGGFDVAEAWEGQVVLYTYDARARGRVVDVRWAFPDFEGLREPQQGGRSDEQYTIMDPDGAITVSRGVLPLIATSTGVREHPSSVARVELRSGRPGVFSMFDTRSERMATQPATLHVAPLPPAPEGFTGLVGEFVFETALDKERASVGQSVTWSLQVAGDGTLEGFAWSPPPIDGATVYAGETQRVARVEDGAYLGFAMADNVLVPTTPGRLDVPPLELITFSTVKGEYITHQVEVPSLMVTGASDAGADVESFAVEPDAIVEGDGIDFRDIYRYGLSSTPFLGPVVPLIAGVAALPGAGVFGILCMSAIARRRRRATVAEVAPTAASLLRSLPPEPAHVRWAILDGALRLALAERSEVAVEDLDRTAAVDALPAPLGDQVGELFAILDRARFAGIPPGTDPEAVVRAAVAAVEAA